MAYLNRTTKQWQEIDTAHHLHPFTDYKSLAKEGSIIVTKADGVHLTTSDDKQLLAVSYTHLTLPTMDHV